ncbi:hypothetical protein BH24CHL4_BH24CHL4_10590 [soil metagenome]
MMNPLSGSVTRYITGLMLLAAMLVVSAIAPGQLVIAQDSETEADGSVRFIHASPDAPAVDILLDGAPVAQGIEFGIATEYAAVSPGDHNVQVVPAGESAAAALIDETIGVDSGEAYTVVVANLLAELELQTFQSNTSGLPEGQSRIRAVSLSPDAGDLDIFRVGGDQWFDNVSFGEDTEHHDVDAGTYDLEIRLHDSDQTLLSAPGFAVGNGNEHTLYILGRQSDESLIVLPLAVSVQAPCAEVLGLGMGNENACLRVVHGSLDAVAVDIYVEDALVVENLEPGMATEFFVVPPGDGRSVKLVTAGGTTDDFVVDVGVDLHGGEAREVVVAGNVTDLKAVNESVDLSPLSVGQARLRLVQGSADSGDIDFLVVDGDEIFGGVGFESFTDYVLVDAGEYAFLARQSNGDSVLFRGESIVLEAGMVYTGVTAGSVDGGSFTLLLFPAPAEVRTGAAGELIGASTPAAGVEEGVEVAETTPTPLSPAPTPDLVGTPES